MAMNALAESQPAWGRRLHFVAALIVTAAIIYLHVVNLQQAGGLWRDEAAVVRLAEMPSLAEVWAHLEHESFPLLFTLTLRIWQAAGLGESDFGLRLFGFSVGMALLAVLWWNAWTFSASPPGWSLILLGLNGTTIRWGDSLRAYGLGVFFALLTCGLVERVMRAPSRGRVILAMGAGLLAVQTLYQNAFIFAAILAAAALGAAVKKNFRRALLLLSLGLPAALSLLPYLGVIRRANEWNLATQIPLTLGRIWEVLSRALTDPATWLLWLWLAVLVLACFSAIMKGKMRENRGRSVYFVGLILFSSVAYFTFLRLAKFPTEVWYYLPLLAVVAVAADALIQRVSRAGWTRLALSVAMLLTATALLPGLRESVATRMTNLDFIARQVARDAAPGDLILIHPWFCGATFLRYYQGSAPWRTIPPLENDGLQRLDLFKAEMRVEDPIEPVLAECEDVLRAGGRVWLVGYFIFLDPPQLPAPLPRPGEGPEGWRGAPYMAAYGMQTTYFLQRNAASGGPVEITLTQKVNPFEHLPVSVVTGWRGRD